MASKSRIFAPQTFTNFAEFHLAMRAKELRPFISRTQGDEIAHTVDERGGFPATVALDQRTPKGTVYVYLDGVLKFTINQRGEAGYPTNTGKHVPL
jgi:hypothetical protein